MTRINQIREQLTNDQRAILREIWYYFLRHEQSPWIPSGILYNNLEVNKAHVYAALSELGGSIAYETPNIDKRRYVLTIVGILLTEQGKEVSWVLGQYLGYVKDRYLADPEDKISIRDAASMLELTEDEWYLLRRTLWVSSFHGGGGGDETNLPLDVDRLVGISNFQDYVEEYEFSRFDPGVPIGGDNRVDYMNRKRIQYPVMPDELVVGTIRLQIPEQSTGRGADHLSAGSSQETRPESAIASPVVEAQMTSTKSSTDKETRVDAMKSYLLNHRVTSVIVLIGILVIGLAQFTDALKKVAEVITFVWPSSTFVVEGSLIPEYGGNTPANLKAAIFWAVYTPQEESISSFGGGSGSNWEVTLQIGDKAFQDPSIGLVDPATGRLQFIITLSSHPFDSMMTDLDGVKLGIGYIGIFGDINGNGVYDSSEQIIALSPDRAITYLRGDIRSIAIPPPGSIRRERLWTLQRLPQGYSLSKGVPPEVHRLPVTFNDLVPEPSQPIEIVIPANPSAVKVPNWFSGTWLTPSKEAAKAEAEPAGLYESPSANVHLKVEATHTFVNTNAAQKKARP